MFDFFEYKEMQSQNGYTIHYGERVPQEARKLVIMCHGFVGSMEGRTVSSLAPMLVQRNIGVIAFDWCGHGSSRMSGEYFTVVNCLRDLDTIFLYASEKFPQCEITLLGTSFGAYVCLLYNSIYLRSVKKLVARCCALDMRSIFETNLGIDLRRLLNYKSITIESERPLTITDKFYDELAKYNAIEEFKPQRTAHLFVHGTLDCIAPYYIVKEFCEDHCLNLESIEGADHFMSDDTHLLICNNAITKFICS